MRVLTSGKKIGAEVPMSFFNFNRFEGKGGDFYFIDSRINFKGLADIKKHEDKIVYFEIEEPNRFSSSDPNFRREEYEWDFYKILSVCPYTTEWLNKVQGQERRQFVFFPFDKKLFPVPAEKIYDVIYFGGIHSREIARTIKIISKFKYRFIAPNEEKTYAIINRLSIGRKIKSLLGISAHKKYLTDQNVSHEEKLRLISKTKVTIVHNMLFHDVFAARQIQKIPDFRNNAAFAEIPDKNIWRSILDFFLRKEYIVPQQKTRLFEAALSRSLILCRKDSFNIVERFFNPGTEFVYYEEGRLEEKLREILEHYNDYQQIIDNAYKKVQECYTTEVFFEKYLEHLTD